MSNDLCWFAESIYLPEDVSQTTIGTSDTYGGDCSAGQTRNGTFPFVVILPYQDGGIFMKTLVKQLMLRFQHAIPQQRCQ